MAKQFIIFPKYAYEGYGEPKASYDDLEKAKVFIRTASKEDNCVDRWLVFDTDTLEVVYKT